MNLFGWIEELFLSSKEPSVSKFESQFIARPTQSLNNHITGVANKCYTLSKKIGCPNIGSTLGYTHDIGKYSDEFQEYIRLDDVSRKAKKGKVDHATAGGVYAVGKIKNSFLGELISLCSVYHHGGLGDCVSPDGERFRENPVSKEMLPVTISSRLEKSLPEYKLCVSRFKKEIKAKINERRMKREFDSVVRKIGSISHGEDIIKNSMLGLFAKFMSSCLVAADHLDAGGLDMQTKPDWNRIADDFEKRYAETYGNCGKGDLNNLRANASKSCFEFSKKKAGVYKLTLPTGAGKTASSLRFAINHAKLHSVDKIVYVAPFTTIIDQNVAVAEKLLGKENVLAVHSKVVNESESDGDTLNFNLTQEDWNSPVVVTTAVNFFNSVYASGAVGKKFHHLANSIIIFDEIQATPIKLLHMFNILINFLAKICGTTIVLCTATQPPLDRIDVKKGAVEFDGEVDLVADYSRYFEKLKRVNIVDARKRHGYTLEDMVEFSKDRFKAYGSLLIVVNTKGEARELYDELKGTTEHVYHLSTGMCGKHRNKTLDKVKQCLNTKTPIILVSTQLIEAGVDIDFNCGSRYIAGFDSILQTAGRVNREGKNSLGDSFCYIVNMQNEGFKLSSLPDIKIGLDMTERVLREFSGRELNSLEVIGKYFEYYFSARKDGKLGETGMDYEVNANKKGEKSKYIPTQTTLLDLLSINSKGSSRSGEKKRMFKQAFRSAGNEFTVIEKHSKSVIVPYDEKAEELISRLGEGKNNKDVMKKLQPYMIEIFKEDLMDSYVVEISEGIFKLKKEHYSEEVGYIK